MKILRSIAAAVLFVALSLAPRLASAQQRLPYVPVVTPSGSTMAFTMKDGVKEFRLTAEPVKREFAKGMVVNAWGYNGSTPGPTIEAVEGDRVRIVVKVRAGITSYEDPGWYENPPGTVARKIGGR